MLNAPELTKTAATESLPATEGQGTSDKPVKFICDLAEADAFYPSTNTPPVSVLNVFGADRLHQCRLEGSWDLERAIKDNPDCLVRSYSNLLPNDDSHEWEDLIFKFGHRSFLCADKRRVVGYAGTHLEAERVVKKFTKTYASAPAPAGGVFYLIEQRPNDIACQAVTLPPETILGDETLGLHYGSGSREWHQDFVKKLRERIHGLSIFEGKPGTGKTCYLRHLMGVLKDSHRFYFIPTQTMGVLSKPQFIGFWAEQRRNHANRKFVVVLEDSDAALMTRATDNREQVSAILNLSDGMLADFLRLQIICTINCSAADIDPALLRPGRLLCHRIFRRLDYNEAVRLAERLGRKLPQAGDYSLAEIFAGHEMEDVNRPRIGFAA